MEQVIAEYQVRRPLAVGGMGETLLAEAPGGDLVVLKRLLPHLHGDEEAERCFREERRIAGRLDHPNIVHAIGEVEHLGQPVLVLEYVDGCSARDLLAHALEHDAPLQVAEACAIVEAAARGLHFAHSLSDEAGNPLSLIHRDVSPANILISSAGAVKVIDFGVVKAWDAEDRTATGVIKGKIGYMSPEQAVCEPLDARADVFALGVVLWELLIGDRLFAADSPMATAYRVLEAEIPKPSARRSDIPARIDAIVMNALERDAGHRTESAQAFERSLAEWRVSAGVEADLAALLERCFPDGPPGLGENGTQLVGSSGSSTGRPTTLEGGGPRGVPLPPPPAPEVLPLLELDTDDEDLTSTRLDPGIGSQMRNVRRGKVFRRLLYTAVALGVAAAVVISATLLPTSRWFRHSDDGSAPPAVFFSYIDESGTEVIVSSLNDVPRAQRPTARRIDLSQAPLTVERPAQESATDLGAQLRRLMERLGPPINARAEGPAQVVQGLFVPILVALLVCTVMFWLLSRARDGFVRWTLRLLLLFVAAVGLYRMIAFGAFGRPGLNAIERSRSPVPVRELAPALRELLTQPTGAPLAPPGGAEIDN